MADQQPKKPAKAPQGKPAKAPEGKPTIEQDNHDQNVGQRGGKTQVVGTEDGKPTIGPETHGENYGQRPGSTTSEDNDVE